MACPFHLPSLVLFCAVVFPMGGCGKSSDDLTVAGKSSDDLTVADVAAALNAHWWNLEIPEDFDSGRFLRVHFKDESGNLKKGKGGGLSGWGPGSHAKVFLMDLDEERMRYAIVSTSGRSRGSTLRGTMANKLFNLGEGGAKVYVPVGSTVSLDQILIRGSESGRVTFGELLDGEIGIAVSAEPLD